MAEIKELIGQGDIISYENNGRVMLHYCDKDVLIPALNGYSKIPMSEFKNENFVGHCGNAYRE